MYVGCLVVVRGGKWAKREVGKKKETNNCNKRPSRNVRSRCMRWPDGSVGGATWVLGYTFVWALGDGQRATGDNHSAQHS